MRKGSVTIFSSLAMILVAAMLFSLLEITRFCEIERLSQLQTELAVEAVFANYSTVLWEEYHLLACDTEGTEELLTRYGNSRYDDKTPTVNLLQFQVDKVSVKGYTRLTDYDGKAYAKAVSAYMQKNILYESVMNIYNQYEAVRQMLDSLGLDDSIIGDALDLLRNQKTKTTQNNKETNPLTEIKEIMERGILELVLEDTSQLSEKEAMFDLEQRMLKAGKNPTIGELNWTDKIFLQQYFLCYMSNYLKPQKEGALDYELEYIIGNQATDIENLEHVVTALLATRMAANFLYLSSNVEKSAEAEAVAVSLTALTGNPGIKPVVKKAVLVAWALGESILDIRALLSGKRIPLLKNDLAWTLELEEIGKISSGFTMSKEAKNGLSYEEYLGILLLFKQSEHMAKKAMNIQESFIRQKYDLSDFRMDDYMINSQIEITYKYRRIFPTYGGREFLSTAEKQIITNAEYEY